MLFSLLQSLALTEWIQWPESPAPGAAARAVVGARVDQVLALML